MKHTEQGQINFFHSLLLDCAEICGLKKYDIICIGWISAIQRIQCRIVSIYFLSRNATPSDLSCRCIILRHLWQELPHNQKVMR